MNTLKVGLDIHGVIDAFPERFKMLSSALAKDGAEVHIVTGIKRSMEVDAMLESAGITFTHYFSIVEQLEFDDHDINWVNGLPFTDEKVWNYAKRNYCDRVGIDFMFDDSPTYLETFHDIDSTYVHVINRNRVKYETR